MIGSHHICNLSKPNMNLIYPGIYTYSDLHIYMYAYVYMYIHFFTYTHIIPPRRQNYILLHSQNHKQRPWLTSAGRLGWQKPSERFRGLPVHEVVVTFHIPVCHVPGRGVVGLRAWAERGICWVEGFPYTYLSMYICIYTALALFRFIRVYVCIYI